MLRKVILVGDPPETGGAVLPNGCPARVNGVSKARMDGEVWCEACQSTGTIAKAGGPYRPGLYGSHEVLEGDLVLCQCPVPPKLVARAISSGPPLVRVDDRIESMGAVPPPFRQFVCFGSRRRRLLGLEHSMQFLLQNKANGVPLSNTPYRITASNNTVYIGVADGDGLTEVLESDQPFTAEIEVPYYGCGDENSRINNQDREKCNSCGC